MNRRKHPEDPNLSGGNAQFVELKMTMRPPTPEEERMILSIPRPATAVIHRYIPGLPIRNDPPPEPLPTVDPSAEDRSR